MRILHVYKDVYPPVVGGIEKHIDNIRRSLPDFDHEVLVCARAPRTRRGPAPSGRGGTETLVGEFGRLLSTPISPAFPRWLRRLSRGAVVHAHMPNPLAELSALLRPRSVPLVVTYHADIYRQRALLPLYRPLVVRCLRSADTVLVGSRRLRDESPLIQAAGVDAEVVPFGIDLPPADPSSVGVAEIQRLYGAEHLLAVGVLRYYKGYDRLISAAREFEWPVVIVGDGPERQSLTAQVHESGLEHRVHLVGRVSDERLAAHLAAATAFALPAVNRAEAFGIALLEAQAAGLPVIATDVGTGIVEAFEPGETGLLVQPNDGPGLVAAIATLMGDPALRARMGSAGRQRIEARHSLQAMAQRLGPLYERLGKASPGR